MNKEDIEAEMQDREETRKRLEEERRSIQERKAFWKLKQEEYLKALGAINPDAAQKYLEVIQKRKQQPKVKIETRPREKTKSVSGGFFGRIKKLFE